MTCRCARFFSGEGHWARECPDKGDKGRKGGKSWDRDRDKGKGYGGGKRSLAFYNQFKSLEVLKQRLFRGLSICQNCAVALLCSAKTCIDQVHCTFSLAKEEEGIMMIEAYTEALLWLH